MDRAKTKNSLDRLLLAANEVRLVYATPNQNPEIMDIAINNLSIACNQAVCPREFWVNTDYTPEFENNPPWIIAKTSELPIDSHTWIKVREVLEE